MGSFANTLFTVMLGWFQSVVSTLWSAFTSEKGGSFIKWIGNHWLILAAVLCLFGLAIDLVVYVLRWRPFRVWKSFFLRSQKGTEDEAGTAGTDEAAEEAENADAGTYARKFRDKGQRYRFAENTNETEIKDVQPKPDNQEKQAHPDREYAAYRRQSGLPEDHTPGFADSYVRTSNVRRAVPEDSPYRRPAEKDNTMAGLSEEADRTESQDRPADSHTRYQESPTNALLFQQKRRRRLRVGDLFSDPEEELQEFEAPQHLIDSHQAYHEPVYPSGWNKNGDGEE